MFSALTEEQTALLSTDRHSLPETFNQEHYLMNNKIKRMKQAKQERHLLKGEESVRLYALLKMFEYILFSTIWITNLAVINLRLLNMLLQCQFQNTEFLQCVYTVFCMKNIQHSVVKVIEKESQAH